VGNALTLQDLSRAEGRPVGQVAAADVGNAFRRFVETHRDLLGVDVQQLGEVGAGQVRDDLWHVSIAQRHRGVVVRDARVAGAINSGNLVVVGAENWTNVSLDPTPRLDADEALALGFRFADGRASEDLLLREPRLEIVPTAAATPPRGGVLGRGYGHLLVWTFVFQRPPDHGEWEVMVDARTGEVVAFQDLNQHAERPITGGVYPVTNTEVCPANATCGIMQSGWPMPWADTGLPAPANFTNGAGLFDFTGGTATTTLAGRFVRISDVCGPISQSSATGDIDLGGTNGQHDCTTGGGSLGNTAASRSAFYEVNRIQELARGYLPANTWLQGQIVANVNIAATCNSSYSPTAGTINFSRSGGGCRNSGEIAGIFDHEWAHGLDDNDTGGSFSNSSEAYGDIAGTYRLQTSCVGHGFWWTSDRGCGQTADGTGFNANEALTGALHCDLDCSGMRDADWARHNPNAPDTPLGFVCSSCSTGLGPCGRQAHCAAAPTRQAAWDLVARDLRAAPFSLDRPSAFIVGNKVFYQGSGLIDAWHSCTCGGTSDGCGATNGYMQWLAADDDNGNLSDGTPHMTALFAAYDRHGIACATPTPVNSGCAAGPASPPTGLTVTPGSFRNTLAWSLAPGATRYWVFRTEGHAGCDFGKALIAEVTGTGYVDAEVANGRPYHYNVVAAGPSSACYSPAGACVSGTPVPPPDIIFRDGFQV
jgi:hypothetical protein